MTGRCASKSYDLMGKTALITGAAGLLGVYLAYHISRGRLGWR